MASLRLLSTLLLLASAASASACSEAFCPSAWVMAMQRGDGSCDLSCNIALCGFDGTSEVDFSTSDCYRNCSTTLLDASALGDFECDLALDSEVCGWDAGDCGYCANGCSAYVGFQPSLGNGECEQACNTVACAFDGGDCVPSRQGDCNSGCYLSMLEDQTCQLECLVEACNYDNGACDASLCAVSCYPHMQGDGVCQSECDLESCLWDLSDCDCASGCHTTMLGNGICESVCYTQTCEWDMLDCECARGCLYSDLGAGKTECLEPACNFDAWDWTEDSCADGAVLSCEQACLDVRPNQFGLSCTTNFSCRNATVPFIAIYCEDSYTPLSIYPVNGHILPDKSTPTHPVVYYVEPGSSSDGTGSLGDPFQSLQQAFNQANQMYVDLLLLPGTYYASVAHLFSRCQITSTTLLPQQRYFPNKRIRVKSANCEEWRTDCQRPTLLLDNAYKCTNRLPESFALEYYNVMFTTEEGVSRLCSSFSPCPPSIFSVPRGSVLSFTNVTFQRLPSMPVAGIGLFHARLELNNVDFVDISLNPLRTGEFAGIIASNSSAEVVYRGGKVSLLNNGVEYRLSYKTKGFLALQQGSVWLQGVHFSCNYVGADFALLAFAACDHCEVDECVFANNLGTVLQYSAFALQAFSEDWQQAQVIARRLLHITNCVFRNNTGYVGSSVVAQFGSVLHSFTVSNCSFLHEYAEQFGVLSIAGASSALTEGYWRYTYSETGKPYKVFFPTIRVTLRDLTFVNCTVGSYGVLSISQIPSILLSGLIFQGFGAFGHVNRFTNTLNAFPSLPNGVIPPFLPTVLPSPCLSIVNVTQVQDLTVETLTLEQFECCFGLYLVNCSSGDVGDLRAEGNTVTDANGAVLLFNFSRSVVFSHIYFYANRNEVLKGQGIVNVVGPGTILLRNSEFADNKASKGGVIYCSTRVELSIANSSFSNNEALTGGVLYMDLSSALESAVLITASEFRGNTATLGGVLAFALDKGRSTLSLLLSNSIFRENHSVVGSVLYISGLVLLGQGLVTDCQVVGNSASETGTLHLASGSLSLVRTVLEGNSAKDGSGVYRDCSSGSGVCSLVCTDVSLISNTGTAVISLQQSKSFIALQLLCKENSGSCLSLSSTSAQCHYCEFIGNTASAGAGFLLSHSNLTMTHSTHSNNSVEGNGGVGMLIDASFLLCHQCDFSANTASRQGGALYLKDSTISLSNSSFRENQAKEGGFALSLYRSSSTVENTQFTGNFGTGIGVISLLLASMNFTSCLMSGNHYFKLTGGISLYLSNLSVRRSEFSQQSSYSGSFLYISQGSVLIEDSSFREGAASSSGGAVAIVASTVELRKCVLSNLTAELGAAVFLQSEASLNIYQCELTNITVGKTDLGVVNGYRSSVHVLNSHFSHFTQSAITGEEMELSLHRTLFQHAEGNNGGAVSCVDCRRVQISASTFRNISATSRGGALYLAGSLGTSWGAWVIENSTIEGCEAPEGGAVLAENCSLAVVGNVFVSNVAQGKVGQGGAVLLSSRSTDKMEMRNNTFRSNSAGLQGGAICWRGFQPDIRNNSYAGNSGQYGNDIASFAVQLALSPGSPARIRNCASGQSANTTLVLELLDHYGQRVTNDNSSYAFLTSLDNTSFAGTTQVVAAMGLFTFSSFSIIAQPGLNTSLRVTTTALNSLIAVSLLVSMRECDLGEAESNNQCVPCAFGSYNLVPGSNCKECPAEAHCYGNYSLGPRAGYWRPTNSSELLLACPYTAACLGSTTTSDLVGQCAQGYEGNMCQTCAVGYFRWSRVRCSQCPSSVLRGIEQVILGLVITLLLVLLIKQSLNANRVSNSLGFIHVKIFLDYLQLVMLFGSFNLAWPDLMLQLFNAQEAVGGFPEFLFSFACLYADETELQNYERKLLALSLLQPLLVAVSTAVWAAVALCRKSLRYIKNEAVGSGIVLFFVALPSVMRATLEVLHCKELLSGEYWVVGLDMRCWTSHHFKYALGLAVPCLLLWGLGVPALTGLFLRRQRRHSNEAEYKVRFGFLAAGYQHERFYWEYVIIYRKLAIIAFIVFFAQVSLFLQALPTLGVLLLSVTLQSFLRPYSQPVLNSLEQRSLTVVTLTLYSGLFFYHESWGGAGETLLFAVVLGLNLVFIFLGLAKIGAWCLRRIWKRFQVSSVSPEEGLQNPRRQAETGSSQGIS